MHIDDLVSLLLLPLPAFHFPSGKSATTSVGLLDLDRLVNGRANDLAHNDLLLVPHALLPVLVSLDAVPGRLDRRLAQDHDAAVHARELVLVRLLLGMRRALVVQERAAENWCQLHFGAYPSFVSRLYVAGACFLKPAHACGSVGAEHKAHQARVGEVAGYNTPGLEPPTHQKHRSSCPQSRQQGGPRGP